MHAAQKANIKGGRFKKLRLGLGTASTDALEDLHKQPDFSASESGEEHEDEDGDEADLPASLRKLMNIKKKVKKDKHAETAKSEGSKSPKMLTIGGCDKKTQLKGHDAMERECSVLGSDVKATVLGKAARMHSMMTKHLESVKDQNIKKDMVR